MKRKRKQKRKMTAAAMALAIGFSTWASGVSAQQASSKDTFQAVPKSTYNSPVDLGIANDEKLIEMLKKEGKIKEKATPEEAEKVLKKYLKAKTDKPPVEEETANFVKDQEKKLQKKVREKGLNRHRGKGHGWFGNHVDPVEKEKYNGETREDQVLVLAIDFPDYEKSSITPEETDMYYDDYTHEHFQNMIFGSNGYEGPNGENLVSMKQYYEAQSGGSYTVDGDVAGWYTADHPAAYYGGNYPTEADSDHRARALVKEALAKAAQDPDVHLGDYDQWDRYDLDGDGNLAEPDGIIDHLMVIHSGVGEEAGGGSLGADAIWSHRWSLAFEDDGTPATIPGSETDVPYWGGQLAAIDYTIEPEDGAAGVFAHEFGHDLGLPDEYDTQYSGEGEPVSYWSIMSSGSWAGDVPGTEPTGFSPYAKEYLQNAHGGNWLSGETLNQEDITRRGTEVLLDESSTKGTNNDAVRIDLPQKETVVNTPASGTYEYFSGSGNSLNNFMTTTVDLSNAAQAELTFKTWYEIETGYDYAYVQVSEDGENWNNVAGNITNNDDPAGAGANQGNGIDGSSDGWTDAVFDLSDYAGKQVQLRFRYVTDGGLAMAGFYADDIKVTADGQEVFADDAEGASPFEFNGFKKDEGKFFSDQYYLLEWRSHHGIDEGLDHIRRGDSLMSYDGGLVVWYVDNSYDNNWTGIHPGEGFLGVVDADQRANRWSDGTVAETRYQMHDAAFSLDRTERMFIDYRSEYGLTMRDYFTRRHPLFNDRFNYSNRPIEDAGRDVPSYGLKFLVTGESRDDSVGKVLIFK
ncbi:immune inhibitor A [Halobacillus salinarum]|uniref:Immune inhibitor A n=1 Tax=Halobacillus salinarum TaxID=2932257 RepID=A0ABY4EUF0_9BACI|nr:immune inhibitor A domain-containing protein [Halobacillus salinarum]UOQ45761.1 immune inhibitor A [Halobacillus salinarum]